MNSSLFADCSFVFENGEQKKVQHYFFDLNMILINYSVNLKDL